jgi:hypothetical protein
MAETSNETTKLYTYWMKWLKRAKKLIPSDDWKDAETRLSASETGDDGAPVLPVVNQFRNHYESSRAYLDQRDPSFKVTTAPAYRSDPDAIKRAECEQAYLEAIWREQNCQKAESRKLHSGLMRNIGFTLPVFDPKKWMPGLKYLPAVDVRLDPDSRGLKENMNAWAYREILTFNEFRFRHKDLSKEELDLLKKAGTSSLEENELDDIPDDDKPTYKNIIVWHIFAKNCAVNPIYEESDDETKKPLKEETKTRYLQYAEGLKRPLRDSEWAFDLDHDEHFVTILDFNKLAEGLYGYTDYKQMKRMDGFSDNVMSYIESDAFYSAIRKYLAGDSCPDDEQLNHFINDPRLMVLREMLDESGNPKLKEASLRQSNPALIQQYDLMEDAGAKASGQNELMAESMSDFKEVTALGVQFQEQKLHQRINLRLGGPDGYEKSIQEDAVKMLEIAHQMVPRFSAVLVTIPAGMYIEETGMMLEEDTEQIHDLPWDDAKQAILKGGKLLKLGVDAIVGSELAEFWMTSEDVPIEEIRLSTKVAVVPGSTRTITQEQQAADMTEYYSNVLWPTVYEPMGRFDLAVRYLSYIGTLKGIDNMGDFLPGHEEIQQFLQQQQQAAEQQMMMEQQQQQQQLEQTQASKEAELQHQAVKNELEIQKDMEKAEIEKNKMSAKQPAGVT